MFIFYFGLFYFIYINFQWIWEFQHIFKPFVLKYIDFISILFLNMRDITCEIENDISPGNIDVKFCPISKPTSYSIDVEWYCIIPPIYQF